MLIKGKDVKIENRQNSNSPRGIPTVLRITKSNAVSEILTHIKLKPPENASREVSKKTGIVHWQGFSLSIERF
jgi:hypothetical protein